VDAAVALRILAAYPLIAFVNGLFARVLVAANRDRDLLRITASVLTLNVAANVALLPRYGFEAAAAIAIVTELIALTMFSRVVRATVGVVPNVRYALVVVVAGGLMAATTRSTDTAWLAAVLAVGVYGTVLVAMPGTARDIALRLGRDAVRPRREPAQSTPFPSPVRTRFRDPGAKSIGLSVVMPCLDASGTIESQLDALAAQRWDEPWELVVVDNGSVDGTVDIVAAYEDRLPLRVLVSAEKRSGPYARNVGCRAAAGELLLFCDADDIVADGWLAATADALADRPLVGSRHEVERLNPGWLVRSREAPLTEGLARWPHPPHFDHAATCGLGVRRDVYNELGGFDESLRMMYDTDFCFRAQIAGVQISFAADAVVHYRYRDTMLGIFAQARAYGRDDALLQRRYRIGDGRMRRLSTWPVENWKPVFRTLPQIRDRTQRARLAWTFGWQVGRYEGSVRHRVLAL
jgi:glycosyltransferase involved in cell wall biosynthesis